MPGNNTRFLEAARNLPADVLIPDLEDSVPLAEKERARELIAKALPGLSARGQRIFPRVNALDTGLLEADVAAVVGPYIHGINVGKVGSAWEVQQVDGVVTHWERKAGLPPGTLRLAFWLETARGVLNAFEICRASPRIIAVAFGAEDYSNDMAIQRSESGEELAFPRAWVPMAARAAQVLALDTPHVAFRDTEALKREIQKAKHLGYKGKFSIHPSQVEIINTLFSPTPEETEYSRRVVQAFEEAEAQGRAATSLDGNMIDMPHYKRARALLAQAEAIRKAESKG